MTSNTNNRRNYVVRCKKCNKTYVYYSEIETEVQSAVERFNSKGSHTDEYGAYCDGMIFYEAMEKGYHKTENEEKINIEALPSICSEGINLENEENKNFEVAKLVKAKSFKMDDEEYLAYLHNLSTLMIDIYKTKTIKSDDIGSERIWTWEGYWNKAGESTIHTILLQKDSRLVKDDLSKVLEYIKARTRVDRDDIITRPNCANFKNCIIDFSSGKVEVIPIVDVNDFYDYGFLNVVPIEYDPDAKCPTVDILLKEILGSSNKVDLVLELMASFLMNDTRFKKAFILAGRHDTGKSTVLNIFDNFLSKKNISSVSIQQMNPNNNKFAGADLDGKMANIVDEMPRVNIKNIETFKNATGGSIGLRVEHKRKDGYIAKPTCKHIFTANELGEVDEEITESFFSRIIFILFENAFFPKKGDPDWKTYAFPKSEMSGLLNRVLVALDRLLENRGYSYDEDPEKQWNDYIESYKQNPLSFFTDNCTEQIPYAGWIRKEFLYLYYRLYCMKVGMKPYNKNLFSRHMKKVFGVSDCRPKAGDKQYYAWSGITLKDVSLSPYFEHKYPNKEYHWQSDEERKVKVTYKCEKCGEFIFKPGDFSRVDNAYGIKLECQCGNDKFVITHIEWRGSNFTKEQFEEYRKNRDKVEWKEGKLMTFDEFEKFASSNETVTSILDNIDTLLSDKSMESINRQLTMEENP